MSLPEGHDRNADQIAFWNGVAGRHWTERQSVQDVLLAPVTERLIARIGAQAGQRILDIGCGTGAIAIELARQVGPSGHVLGIDISVPMLERARQLTPREAPADYVLADATVYPFDPQSFDQAVSRFGVMFFADPVLSFRNLRTALRPNGRLAFACWREPRENGWMMAPLMAVYRHVPKMPQLGPEDPGPFAFADEARVKRILGEAGFTDIAMEACPLTFDIAAGRGLEAAVQGALEIGPASRALEGHPPEVVAAAIQSIRDALAPFAKGDAVLLPGAIWIVTARAS
ncbi:methyltransferase domain-containing protein [Bradyrhizobium sp.]|uniref:class I SAM-dependent methyltransferase n=1 Tax=Bradyrhizobium sp. TaxID=376 RepID=UPI001D23DA1D|nr:methyltransferase domain-containing protein [Bradyrhizobium sp.]MBI5319874.1 methyltransferase domain-containing protein [Bradyrhizobium sp.]